MIPPETQPPLAAALGLIPSGVFVLTVRHGEAETGVLVSWVQQCSFDPPAVSVAVKRGRYVGDWLAVGAACTLNILGEGQSQLLKHFAAGFGAHEPAFTGLEIERRDDAAPILLDALAHLDARVVSRQPAGDHDLFILQLDGGAVHHAGRPRVHLRKNGLRY